MSKPKAPQRIRVDRRTVRKFMRSGNHRWWGFTHSQLDRALSKAEFIDTAKLMAELMIERGYKVPEVNFSPKKPAVRKKGEDDDGNAR